MVIEGKQSVCHLETVLWSYAFYYCFYYTFLLLCVVVSLTAFGVAGTDRGRWSSGPAGKSWSLCGVISEKPVGPVEAFLPLQHPFLRKNYKTHSQMGEAALSCSKVRTTLRTSSTCQAFPGPWIHFTETLGTWLSCPRAFVFEPSGVLFIHLPCGDFLPRECGSFVRWLLLHGRGRTRWEAYLLHCIEKMPVTDADLQSFSATLLSSSPLWVSEAATIYNSC